MSGLQAAVVLVILILAAAFLLSIAVTVAVYWDFTLTRDGDSLRIRRGLLVQRLDTLPLRRVQAIRIEENLVRRILGLAAVKVDVAGRAGSDDSRNTGLLLPVGPREHAFRLVTEVLGVADPQDLELEPMPRRARSRRLARAAVVSAAALVLGLALAGTSGLAALLVAPVAVAAALDAYRALGHGRVGDVVVGRSGVLVRRTVFVPVDRLQSVALAANPLQRWRRLGTLELQIARSPGAWGGPELIDLDAGHGRELLAQLGVEADRSLSRVTAPP